MERSELRKQIFLTLQSNIPNVDSDGIKDIRDTISESMFLKPESELNDLELEHLLFYVRNNEKKCSKKQEYAVRGLAFEFAIHYHNYENFRLYNKLGQRKSAADVKLMIQEQYRQHGFRGIDNKYKDSLYKETANPKCNELLYKADFRKTEARKPESFYYGKMKANEASYLISRFGQILKQVTLLKPLGLNEHISEN